MHKCTRARDSPHNDINTHERTYACTLSSAFIQMLGSSMHARVWHSHTCIRKWVFDSARSQHVCVHHPVAETISHILEQYKQLTNFLSTPTGRSWAISNGIRYFSSSVVCSYMYKGTVRVTVALRAACLGTSDQFWDVMVI